MNAIIKEKLPKAKTASHDPQEMIAAFHIDERGFSEYTWEEIIAFREQLLAKQEEIEATISVLRDEIILKLDADGTPDGRIVGEKSISVRTTYTTDKDTAKELGAIKTFTTERIDTGLIKAMYLKGAKIPNLQINKIPQILDVVKKQKETENS